MIGEPRIEKRSEQAYAGIRVDVTTQELSTVIPQLIGEIISWMSQHGMAPSGPPLVRYHTIDMPSRLDIELGVPVTTPVAGNRQIKPGALPAGRYATLIYTGPYDGLLQANAALIDWAHTRGLQWDHWQDAKGDAFRARYESYLTDPQQQPDPSQWQTEVAIRLAD
jgi:effector-binding domain-containing protein